MATFDDIFNRLISPDHEGDYSNDPHDPGGETKYGISKRTYPNLIIKELTTETAKLIYKRDFWNVIQADKLPGSVQFQLFDFAVNSGIPTAIRYFQRAVGVADDGYIGPVTIVASRQISECDLIMRLNAERLEYMTKLKNWEAAGKGWARRIASNLRFAASDTEN